MTYGEWILQALLALGLFLILPVSIRVERALKAFRQERGSLEQSAQQLTDAIKDAELAIARLRDVARGAGLRIGEQVERVEATLREIDVRSSDLQLMMDRAEALAGRLESSVRHKPGQHADKTSHDLAPGADVPSRSRPPPASRPPPPQAMHVSWRPPAPPLASTSPTAALAMQRALKMGAGENGSGDPSTPRSVAEQEVLNAVRRGGTKP
jgi:hypothetical protein